METLHKWRLMLGGDDADGTEATLNKEEQAIDGALDALYEYERRKQFKYKSGERTGGSGKSTPAIARWLGDIRRYFPSSVVEVIQKDALRQPGLQKQMLLEPEILEQATPDVHLVAMLMELSKLTPEKTKETARRVIQQVVDNLRQKVEQKTIQTIRGALNRQARHSRPRISEIDWHTTIRKNLKHYQPHLKTIIPEVRVGYGRKTRRALKEVVLCLDQSGSMGESIVYSAIFAAVMASMPTLRTRLIAFDTAVADLTEAIHDPVELLFGVQLGGGTDINKALTYCKQTITQPTDTILILISDLYEGGDVPKMLATTAEMKESGVQIICLLALSDSGTPAYDKGVAKQIAAMDIPVFGCTPDLFPDMMAAALAQRDLRLFIGGMGND